MNADVRRKRIRLAVVASLALPLVAGGQDAGEVEPSARHVSLVAVLANPDAFDGREITLVGYVSLGRDDEAIWLVPDDHDNAILASSVWFAGPLITDLRTSGYAEVKGVFHKRTLEHDPGVGTITQEYVRPWPHAKAAQPPPQRGCSWFL
jgi:hypothetical protein